MAAGWRTVRVFISSTFRDMHAERDHLIRSVFPELRARCAQRNLHLVDVDLRWGVTKEEAEQGKVLEVCLDEIEHCRPFFVGLLGERYGSVPPCYQVPDEPQYDWLRAFEPGHSVTALEIYQGVLRDPTMETRAFFYFRSPAFLADIPLQHRGDFLPENDQAKAKLDRLKQVLRERFPVFEDYPVRFAGLREDGKVKLDSLDEFGRRVIEDLWSAICQQHPLDEAPPDVLEQERKYHESFIENHTRLFIGRTGLLQAIGAHLRSSDCSPLIVTGPPGSGKSSVLAKLAKETAVLGNELFVLPHFIGASPGSSDIQRTLWRLAEELKQRFQLNIAIPNEYEALRLAFARIAAQSAVTGKVLLILDALNQLDEAHDSHTFNWLPTSFRIIASTLEGDCLENLRRRSPRPIELAVDPLSYEERREVVRQMLWGYRKRLDEVEVDARYNGTQMGMVLQKRESQNPLYLLVACEELRLFGEFEQVTRRVAQLPDEIEALFGQVFDRLENDLGPYAVVAFLSLVACSRYGLLETEVLDLLRDESEKPFRRDLWVRLYRNLEVYLRPPGEHGEGLIYFSHEQLKKAVRARYLESAEESAAWHERLARYFRKNADPNGDGTWQGHYPRALSELPFHTCEAGRYDELFLLARDKTFLAAQETAFPERPDLTLLTVQAAIKVAARIDEPVVIAEFLLEHASRVTRTAQENPLDALRSSGLERALELTELQPIENSILSRLVLAWDLKDRDRAEDSRLVLKRLTSRELPRLSHWQADYANFLLSRIAEFDGAAFQSLTLKLVGDSGRANLIETTLEEGRFSEAAILAASIEDARDQFDCMVKIGKAQLLAGQKESAQETFDAAVTLMSKTEPLDLQCHKLREIAKESYEAGSRELGWVYLDHWLQLSGQIASPSDRSLHRYWAIQLLTKDGQFSTAVQLAEEVEFNKKTASLREIAEGLLNARRTDEALQLLEKALSLVLAEQDKRELLAIGKVLVRANDLETAQRVLIEASKGAGDYERKAILTTMLEARGFPDALEVANGIDHIRSRLSARLEIAEALTAASQMESAVACLQSALELVREIPDQWDRASDLSRVAACFAAAGEHESARSAFELAAQTCDEIEKASTHLSAVKILAEKQAASGEKEAARGNLQRAFEIANGLADKRGHELKELGVLEASLGEFDLALTAAEAAGLEYSGWRDDVIVYVVLCLLERNKFSEARETVEQISERDTRVRTLLEIVSRHLEREDIESATKAAQELEPWQSPHDQALSGILRVQWKAGKIAEAEVTAKQIESKRERAIAFREMAKGYLEQGASEKARDLLRDAAELARSDDNKGLTLSISRLQLKAGAADSARNTLARFLSVPKKADLTLPRSEALMHVAKAQVKESNPSSALQTTLKIQDLKTRGNALLEIMKAYVRSGDFDSAETTLQLMSDSDKDDALEIVCVARAQRDEFELALNTAKRISADWQQKRKVLEIADLAAESGDPADAAATLTAAVELVQKKETGFSRIDSLGKKLDMEKLAKVAAKAGQLAVFEDIIEQMEDVDSRDSVLGDLAEELAKAGELSAAKATIERVRDDGYAIGHYCWIARILVKKQDSESGATFLGYATETLSNQWMSGLSRVLADVTIAHAHFDIGELAKAADLLEEAVVESRRLKDESGKATGLLNVAEAWSGREPRRALLLVEEARDAARAISDREDCSRMLSRIAEAAYKSGDPVRARAILTEAVAPAGLSSVREKTLFEEAIKTQIRQSDFEGAVQIALQMKDPEIQGTLLETIGVSQASTGNMEDAAKTSHLILTNRESHVPAIVLALIENGDTISFKQLLIPCAYSLETAFRTCGLLALVYPAKIAQIAQVISG